MKRLNQRGTAAFLLAVIVSIATTVPARAQNDLAILAGWREYSDAHNALYREITDDAYRFLDRREAVLESISSRDEYDTFVDDVRKRLATAFGPLPDKTPLNARTVGSFEHEGLTVEKVIFESRPGFLVTGAVFRESGASGPLPAVLYLCGHTADGFRSEVYQHVCMNLAKKGFLVLAIDPVGQGERLMYFDEERGGSKVGGPTKEHSYAGVQYLFIGRTMAGVRLWDCIRAVDYLYERTDVDKRKIGAHGRSGGGTMSSFLGAMDLRITAAAPECYITSFRRLLQSIGPQDAEQNLLAQIESGLDHGDFLIARGSLPSLVVATTRDFFSIQGVRETVYGLTEHPIFSRMMDLSHVEDDAPHQSTKDNREAVYRFFMDAFSVRGNDADEDISPIPADRLRVTGSGQVTTSGSRSIHELIVEDAAQVLSSLKRRRATLDLSSLAFRNDVRRLCGYREYGDTDGVIFAGRLHRNGYSIEKYIIGNDVLSPLPLLMMIPEGGTPGKIAVCLEPAGKDSCVAEGGLAERLVRTGWVVCAVDLPGYGECAPGAGAGDSILDGVDYNLVFGAQLVGRSITGIQASHISRVVEFLERAFVNDGARPDIRVIGREQAAPAALHAAFLDDRIDGLAILDAPVRWEDVLEFESYDVHLAATVVPGALEIYDMSDLIRAVSDRPLFIGSPVSGDGQPLDSDGIARLEGEFRDEDVEVSIGGDVEELAGSLASWLDR